MSKVLIGYIIALFFSIIVFGLSFFIRKKIGNFELARKIIHISAGLGWIVFKVFMEDTIHPIIISLCCLLLTIVIKLFKNNKILRNKNDLGLIYFAVSMCWMSCVSYIYPTTFDCFGIGMIGLSCGDGASGLIGSCLGDKKHFICKGKSIEGSIACLIASLLAVLLICMLFSIKLTIYDVFFISLIVMISEALSGDYDNLCIPFMAFIFSWILIEDNASVKILYQLSIVMVIALLCCFTKLLDKKASVYLSILLFIIYNIGDEYLLVVLIILFAPTILVNIVFNSKIRKTTFSINKEHGSRNISQLSANCLPAVISIILYKLDSNPSFLIIFFVLIAETIGDSMASDVGVLSKKEPIDICSFKHIQKGMSGGVTILGTVSAVISCLYVSLIFALFYDFNIYKLIIIGLFGFIGVIADSILGAKMQERFYCDSCSKYTEKYFCCGNVTKLVHGVKGFDNTLVNLICNITSGILAYCCIIIL